MSTTQGNNQGFDAAFSAAFGAATREVGETGSEGGTNGINGEGDGRDAEGIPFVTAEGVRPRRRYHSLAIAAGFSAMLLVGLLAISAVVGSGGANSPEGAVRRLADALSNEDPLEASDVMAPSELARLHGTLDKAANKAAAFQLVKNAGAPLTGVDVRVDDLELSTEQLADGYAKVTVAGGTISAETKKAKFSPLLQKALRESGDNRAEAELASLVERAPTFVVAVREDGKWYVSAAYTALEYVRVLNGATAPVEYGAGRSAAGTLGADSPEAAVDEAALAIVMSDWDRVASLTAPGELPLYDYRKVLAEVSGDEKWLADVALVSSQSKVVRRDGDTARVELHLKGTTPDGPWSIDAGCFTGTTKSESTYVSTGTTTTSSDPYSIGTNCEDPGGALLPAVQPVSDEDLQTVRVVRQDGRWFVSPVGTVFDGVDALIDGLDRNTFYQWIGLPQEITPEGSVTLGQTVSVGAGAHVFTLEGTQGQQIMTAVGSLDGLGNSNQAVGDQVDLVPGWQLRVYGPDGELLSSSGAAPYVNGALFDSYTLPVDGTYRVVAGWYGSRNGDSGFTVWNAADAPDAAKEKMAELATISGIGAGSRNATPENPYCVDLSVGTFCTDGTESYRQDPDGTHTLVPPGVPPLGG